MKNKDIQSLKEENKQLKSELDDIKRKYENDSIKLIPIDRICPDTIRDEDNTEGVEFIRLTNSIRKFGQIEPILVKKIGNKTNEGSYYALISGFMRLKALKLIGEKYVKAIFITDKIKNLSKFSYMTNIMRKNYTIFETSELVKAIYINSNRDIESVSNELCINRSDLTNYLSVSKLTDIDRQMITDYSLSDFQTICISKIKDENLRKVAIRHIGRGKLDRYQTIEYIYDLTGLDSITSLTESPKRKFIIKDIRLLYNTIDNIVDTVKEGGVPVEYEKDETADGFTIKVFIKKIRQSNAS